MGHGGRVPRHQGRKAGRITPQACSEHAKRAVPRDSEARLEDFISKQALAGSSQSEPWYGSRPWWDSLTVSLPFVFFFQERN